MELLVRRVEWHFEKNCRRQALAEQLRSKIQQMKDCFTGNALPLPTVEVTAAWNDLPNDTVDALPVSARPGLAFLRAPPPTPAEPAFDADDATSSDSSLSDGRNDGWVFVSSIDTADVVASHGRRGSTAGNGAMARCSYPNEYQDERIVEGDPFQSADDDSPLTSSLHESRSSEDGAAPTLDAFYNMVNRWFLDYRARGMEPFIESLIAFGVVSLGTAPLASRIAHDIIKRVAKISYVESRDLENAIRFAVLTAFKKYWESNDTQMEMSPTPYGINIASLVGSLFDAKVSTARDIQLCLSFLLEGEKCFERLCAMHALLVQANDKLCKSRNRPALMQFKHDITSKDEETGAYLWITTAGSVAIINDILATIERWMFSQTLRREQPRISAVRCSIRNRAVGPRLRHGSPFAVKPLVQ